MTIKIANLLYVIKYLLFRIILRKITLSKNLNLYFYITFSMSAIALIHNINKIIYIRLQKDVKYIFMVN